MSCKSSKTESEKSYQNCLNQNITDRGLSYSLNTLESDIESKSDVFDKIQSFEIYLKDKNLLSELNRTEYLSLISKMKITDFFKQDFKDFNSKNSFIENNLMTTNFRLDLLQSCFLTSFKDKIYYQRHLNIYDKVFLNSYASTVILKELGNEINFQSKTERLTLTFLIYENMYNRFRLE